jgi:programmed cell death protein 4
MPKAKVGKGKFRDKIKHSANAFRRNAPKEGRGGKGTWGNPLDDIGFVDNPPPVALDKGDPNYVPDDDLGAIDAYEEDVWYADHDTYESFFDEFKDDEDEEPQSSAEAARKMIWIVQNVIKMYLLTPEAVPNVPAKIRNDFKHKLEVGSGASIAKVFLSSPYLADEQKRTYMGGAVSACLQERLFNEGQLNNAFLAKYRDSLEYPQALSNLSAFAITLFEENIWSEDMVQMLDRIREKEDTMEEIKRIKKDIDLACKEYFASHQMDAVLNNFNEICENFYHYEVIKIVVNLAMDKDPKARELASKLIGESAYFSQVVVRRGFEILIERLEDLKVDIPDVITILSCFIARAIVDEAIPPSFIQEVALQPIGTSPHAIQCLQKAQHLLNMKLSAQRLSKIWGPGRGRPVADLKAQISVILKAFLNNGDFNELANSLKDLSEPNFNHEFVKQAVLKGADKGGNSVQDAGQMLLSFVEKDLIDHYQVKIGISRVKKGLDNYSVDIPRLPDALAEIEKILEDVLAPEEAVVPADVAI